MADANEMGGSWRSMTLEALDALETLPESVMNAGAEELYKWSSEDRGEWMLAAVFGAMIHALAELDEPVDVLEPIAALPSPTDAPSKRI